MPNLHQKSLHFILYKVEEIVHCLIHFNNGASQTFSVSTFERICRERGISLWPSTKIKRERPLLSSVSCNGTDRVAANAQMPITRGPTAFASTISVKSNQQKSWSSNLSVNNENGTSLNDNKNEDGDRGNIMIQVKDSANQEILYKLQEFEPACDSLVPSYSFTDTVSVTARKNAS
ncbi:hypothetical protein HAX54_043518 [Datura stramonium]|uniref:RWP-RK domain-containing protein n=1 Tax=Datura stramonium TaxID=4076 RepID=A0ABS8SNE2_DATST|nr:hypothetical protein [Datura stramonium]